MRLRVGTCSLLQVPILVEKLLVGIFPAPGMAGTTPGVISSRFRIGQWIKVLILYATENIPMLVRHFGLGTVMEASIDIFKLPNLIKLTTLVVHGTTFKRTTSWDEI